MAVAHHVGPKVAAIGAANRDGSAEGGDGFVEGHFSRRFIVAASCSLRSFNVACLSSNETRDRA